MFWLWVWERKGSGWSVFGLFNTPEEALAFFNVHCSNKRFGHEITEEEKDELSKVP